MCLLLSVKNMYIDLQYLVEPQNVVTFGTSESVLIRGVLISGDELIHTCITLGHRKVSYFRESSFRGSTVFRFQKYYSYNSLQSAQQKGMKDPK